MTLKLPVLASVWGAAALLACGGEAGAQALSLTVGATLGSPAQSPPGGALPADRVFGDRLGLSVGLLFHNATLAGGFALTGGAGLDARVSLDLGARAGLNLDGLLTFATPSLTFYAGPGLSIGGAGLTPSLTAGVNLPFGGQYSVYGEGVYRLRGQRALLRTGLNYSF